MSISLAQQKVSNGWVTPKNGRFDIYGRAGTSRQSVKIIMGLWWTSNEYKLEKFLKIMGGQGRPGKVLKIMGGGTSRQSFKNYGSHVKAKISHVKAKISHVKAKISKVRKS